MITDGPPAPAPHRHPDLHQLTWCPDGDAVARFDGVAWTVPPHLAVWVPAGVEHSVQGRTRGVECLDLKIHHRFANATGDAPALVSATPLLTALLRHLADPHLPTAERRRTEPVLADQLRGVRPSGLQVRLPTDPRARRVADVLLADPADPRSVADWARVAGTSERTLERLVRAGTGTSLRSWRTRVRIAAAIRPLLAGDPVSAVAHRVGYRHAGAFGEAFRAVLGCPPSRYRSLFGAGGFGAGGPSGAPLLRWAAQLGEEWASPTATSPGVRTSA